MLEVPAEEQLTYNVAYGASQVGGGRFSGFKKRCMNFSKVVHGEAEFGGGEDIDMSLLCSESHNSDI